MSQYPRSYPCSQPSNCCSENSFHPSDFGASSQVNTHYQNNLPVIQEEDELEMSSQGTPNARRGGLSLSEFKTWIERNPHSNRNPDTYTTPTPAYSNTSGPPHRKAASEVATVNGKRMKLRLELPPGGVFIVNLKLPDGTCETMRLTNGRPENTSASLVLVDGQVDGAEIGISALQPEMGFYQADRRWSI